MTRDEFRQILLGAGLNSCEARDKIDLILAEYDRLTAALDAAHRELADALGLLASAQAVREGMPESSGWMSVSDILPTEEGTYLVYYGADECYGAEQPLLRPVTKSPVFTENVTHWMPLPKGPEVSHD